MKTVIQFVLSGFLILSVLTNAYSQANYSFEIRCSKVTSSRLAVDMRAVSDTAPTINENVLDIVFGIKWNNAADADLSSSIDNSFGYNIFKSDVEKVKNGFEFQAFYANNTPYHFPNNWTKDIWETICEMDVTINNTGGAPWDFEICEVGFDPTTDLNFNIEGTDYTPVPNGVAPLVIKLLEFDAYRYEDRSAKLSWTAIVDEESDFFDIERSTDGISWALVSSQPILIKNKDINNFYYTDKEVYSPEGDVKLFYYRLRMVNTDGSYSYSPIREVRFDARSVSREGVAKVFPNPVNQVMNVSLPGNMEDYSTLEMALTKSTGQSVLHEKYEEDLPGSLSYDVSALPAGTYFLRLTFDADEQVIPVIIMH